MNRFLFLSLLGLLLTACADLGGTLTPTFAPTQTPAAAVATPTFGPMPLPGDTATASTPATALPPSATPATSLAGELPEGSDFQFEEVADSFTRPVFVADAGDEPGRLFVVQQSGEIYVVEAGQKLEPPFLDLNARVTHGGFEQGLLGLAFHPRYAENGYFYVHYTDQRGDTVVARYQVSDSDPRQADPQSVQVLLQVDQPYANHNGGHLAFGPDGYLYIGLGDGGSGGDPQGNGQKLGTLLGKMLRIDVNNEAGYVIPKDNPFVAEAQARPEIWAYGLRNPWRYAFDRLTGDLYIADVGQGEYEEVSVQPASSTGGENYGWNFMEGLHTYEGNAPAGLVDPIIEYSHNEGGCSITGGYVYRGAALPTLQGLYFFGDFCSGYIWVAKPAASGTEYSKFMETGFSISSFGEDAEGELYVVDHGGAIYRLVAAP